MKAMVEWDWDEAASSVASGIVCCANSIWEIESDSSSVLLSTTCFFGRYDCLAGTKDLTTLRLGFEGTSRVWGTLRIAGQTNTLTMLPSKKADPRTKSCMIGFFLYEITLFQARPRKSFSREYDILLDYRSFSLRVQSEESLSQGSKSFSASRSWLEPTFSVVLDTFYSVTDCGDCSDLDFANPRVSSNMAGHGLGEKLREVV